MPELLPGGGAEADEAPDDFPWASPAPAPLDDDGDGRLARAERLRLQATALERATLQRRAKYVHLELEYGVGARGRSTPEPPPPELRLYSSEGYTTPGDSGAPQNVRPAWFDADLFLEGQRVARENHAGIAEAEMLSLFLLLAFPAGLDPLVATGRSDSPETAGRRYLSTSRRLVSWYTSDPFDPRSEAHRNLVAVRGMHAQVRRACNEASPEELAVKFTIGKDKPRPLTCPRSTLLDQRFAALPAGVYTGPCPVGGGGLVDGLPAVKVRADRYRRPFLTQGEMAITQWGFFGLFITKPQVFAAPRVTPGELAALVHMWAVLGYCLGIEDRFNWALGGLDAVQRRSELYLRTVAVPNLRLLGQDGSACWEHMCRCMVDGMSRFAPLAGFDVHLAYLTEDVLGLGTGLAKTLSWRQTFQLWRLRALLQYLPRWLPSWGRWMSRGLHHLLVAKAMQAAAEEDPVDGVPAH